MAEFTEQQVYEALGLGAQAQEPAEPAAQTSEPEGAQAQEPAAPAEDVQQPAEGTQTEPPAVADAPDDPEDDAAAGTQVGKQPLTPEQRRENAAKRRQQEQQAQQAAINQAVQAAVRQEQDKHEGILKEFFAKAGLKNTITGEPITNMEQFNTWNQQFNDAKLQRDLKAGKLTPEGLATAIGNHPIVKQAQQLVTQDAAAKQAQQTAAAKAKIEGEIAEIHKMDESIGSLEDLMQAPYWPELYAMTKRGYSIKDAHFLLNHDRLEKAKIDAAKQQTMNNARGKDHMTATAAPRGAGSISVPAADLAMFRQFNPGATDAEIQAYYNKYKKG